MRADDRLKREFPLITLPVFILHGTADKVTKPGGSQLFYDTAGSKDKTLKLYEGHAHDLLNDYGREQVLADIIGWIDARLAGATGRQMTGMATPTARGSAVAAPNRQHEGGVRQPGWPVSWRMTGIFGRGPHRLTALGRPWDKWQGVRAGLLRVLLSWGPASARHALDPLIVPIR